MPPALARPHAALCELAMVAELFSRTEGDRLYNEELLAHRCALPEDSDAEAAVEDGSSGSLCGAHSVLDFELDFYEAISARGGATLSGPPGSVAQGIAVLSRDGGCHFPTPRGDASSALSSRRGTFSRQAWTVLQIRSAPRLGGSWVRELVMDAFWWNHAVADGLLGRPLRPSPDPGGGGASYTREVLARTPQRLKGRARGEILLGSASGK